MVKRPLMKTLIVVSLAASLVLGFRGRNVAAAETGKAAKTAGKSAPGAKAAKASRDAAPKAAKHWEEAELGGTREPYAEVTLIPTGRPVLAIHYPWRVHSRPSVEVRWMADDEPDTTEIRPLQFVGSLMRGEITSAVYDVRDKAADTPVSRQMNIGGRAAEIFGDRNSLGQPASMIVFPERSLDMADHAARVVFFPLEGWALDRSSLRLELPAAHFSKPGRIRVWFYREGNLLWWKTLVWPGTK